jgi:type II secretion system protein H
MRRRGFTLIELVVVTLIVGVVAAMAGMRLARGPADALRDEGERLAALLRAAREEAILQGRVLAFEAEGGSYRFLRLEPDGRLQPLAGDALLRPATLPAGILIAGEDILFLPSGELDAFRLVLAAGPARWSVVGTPQGAIRSEAGT